MAHSFPLALWVLFSKLPAASVTPLSAPPQLEVSQTAAGEQLVRRVGPDLWRGSVTLDRRAHVHAREALALIELAASGSFMATDLTYFGPRNRGVAAWPTVTLSSVAANNRDVTFTGLTFNLAIGDYVSFTYGTNPVRYAFHRVVRGTGATYEVVPPVRPGWAAGAAVTLDKPVFKAIIEPGSLRVAAGGRVLTDGASFDFIQTLR